MTRESRGPDPHERTSFKQAAIVLILATLGCGAMLHYYFDLFMPRVFEAHAAANLAGGYSFGHDFYPVWLTSRECIRKGCAPYSPELTRKIQRGLFGRTLDPQNLSDPPADYRTFSYPAFTDLLLWPATLLPFATVRIAVVFLLAGATAASVFLWTRAISWRQKPFLLAAVVLLVLCSYPVLEGLYAGQLGLLVGFLLAASLFALHRGWAFLAGIAMALTAIKPQMTILAMVYLLVWSLHHWRRRGRFSIGLVLAVLVLTAAAMLVWPHWIASWARVLLGYHHYANGPLVGEIFGLGPRLGGTAALGTFALLLTLALTWNKRKAEAGTIEFWLTLSFLLCLTAVTLLPSQGFQDQVILLPGIFLVFRQWKELSSNRTCKVLLAAGAAVLVWPWLAAFGLTLLQPLLPPHLFYSKAIFALPLRTAAVFPFVLLALLGLSLRRPWPCSSESR